MNRRLAHEMGRVGTGEWEVTSAAPHFFHGGNDLRPSRLQPLPDESCPLVRLPAFLTRKTHVFFYGIRLRSLLAEKWDLVHAWEEPYILAGGQIAWWTRPGTALVYRTAQSYDKRYPFPFDRIERYSMSRAAGWICSGQTVANALGSRPGYAGRPMRRIPLGVDLDLFRPDPTAGSAVRRSLGWEPDGPPVVGYLGRFVREKGLDLLMRVLDRLRVPWRALFVGAGPMEVDLRRWAAGRGDQVRICTSVHHEDAPRYVNAMDLLCAPSQTAHNWREQFGRMLIEAFACGVPVVGSSSGEIPYVIRNAGVVVEERDEDAWCRALEELLSSPRRRAEFREQGLDRARHEYAWPVIAYQYLKFFEEILADQQNAVPRAKGERL
jgi:glycosyltransferase involved in cell wall biosynthesis